MPADKSGSDNTALLLTVPNGIILFRYAIKTTVADMGGHRYQIIKIIIKWAISHFCEALLYRCSSARYYDFLTI